MRRLTAREKVLLIVLAILLVGGLYYLLFYMPLTNEIKDLEAQTAQVQNDVVTAQARVAKMQQMQEEIDRIFADANGRPTQIALFDNSNLVMNELNAILAVADSYDLSFSQVANEDNIVRRSVSMQYSCANYQNAKSILSQLHDSQYRCLINSLSITASGNANGASGYSVSAQVTYFEYIEM